LAELADVGADMRTLIIGDSQAAGAPGTALEELLRQKGDTVYHRGISGHGAADWVRLHWESYQGLLRMFQPQRVILVFGSNDPANHALENALLRFKNSLPGAVYYAGPPRYDRNASAQARGTEIRAMVKRVFGSRHLDAWPSTGPEVPRSANGLHFTREGGAVWAKAIARGLDSSNLGVFIGAGVLFVAAGILWATLHQ